MAECKALTGSAVKGLSSNHSMFSHRCSVKIPHQPSPLRIFDRPCTICVKYEKLADVTEVSTLQDVYIQELDT